MIGYVTAFNNDEEMTFNKRKIIDYIEDCHMSDGGYFFAKVEPSGGLETCLAVKTLRLLGVKPKKAGSVVLFWKQQDKEGSLYNPFSIFLAVETYKGLGLAPDEFKKYRKLLADCYKDIISHGDALYSQNKKLSKRGFSSAMSYFGTVGKEFEELFYLVVLGQDLRIKIINREKTIKLISLLQNKNGGFGCGRESHLMATYHALSVLNLLSFSLPTKEEVYNYLIEKWEDCSFLEDLFCIVGSLALINKPLPDINKIIQFVDSCQRGNGGFGRAPVMSIPTIEDSYRAVSVIKICEKYLHKIFLK